LRAIHEDWASGDFIQANSLRQSLLQSTSQSEAKRSSKLRLRFFRKRGHQPQSPMGNFTCLLLGREPRANSAGLLFSKQDDAIRVCPLPHVADAPAI
jgi:hypothetical protein